MQVFIIGTPFETAQNLDTKRLNKQIIECNQILNAINGQSKSWKNHPCTLQYQNNVRWLEHYRDCLILFKNNLFILAKIESDLANQIKPIFHIKEYFDQMKRRLFEKDEEYYKQWSYLGKSLDNWYFVNNEWKYYKNGKKINF